MRFFIILSVFLTGCVAYTPYQGRDHVNWNYHSHGPHFYGHRHTGRYWHGHHHY